MWIKLHVLNSILCVMVSVTNLYAGNPQMVILNVTVNTESKGDFFLYLTDTQDVLLRKDDFDQMGIHGSLGDKIQVNGETFYSLQGMRDVTFEFKDTLLVLDITADPSLLGMQVIDFEQNPSQIPFFTSETSAFLNYKLDYTVSNLPGSGEIDLTQRLGAHVHGWSFLNDGIYSQTDQRRRWTRLMSSVTRDRPLDYTRLIAGDFFSRSGEIGSSLNMAGISYSKYYALDPYFIRNPLISFTGATALPTELEVRLDGVPIRQTSLSPGEFRLENISTRSGAGILEVVLRDPFGKEEHLFYPFYLSANLLKEGLHDYSYNLGFLRERFGEKNNDYGTLAFSGFHKYGFTDSFNAEGSLEFTRHRGLLTSSISGLVQNKGSITLLLAVSRDHSGKIGSAKRLRYGYQGKSVSGRLDFTWRHRDFTILQDFAEIEKIKYESGAGLGSGSRLLGYFNIDYRTIKKYVGTDAWSVSGSYTRSLTSQTSFFATIRRSKDEQKDTTFFMGFQFYPGNRTTLSAQTQKSKNVHMETLQVQKNPPVGEGFGGRAIYDRSTFEGTTIQTFDSNMQLNTEQVILEGAYRHSDGVDIGGISAAGGLSYVGKTLSLSRPITEGFALIQADGLEGVRVYHNGHEVGKTNDEGKLLIPNLSSYYENKIVIDDRDIPLNFAITRLSETISPYFLSGLVIPFDVSQFRAFSGRIFYDSPESEEKKKAAELVLAHIHDESNRFEFQTGYGGEFYVENIPPGEYLGGIQFGELRCDFSLRIPLTQETFTDLGEVFCETPQ